ncbi:ABC-2 type transporter [Streptococcus sanguinis]|uniref:Transport permease protein n=2 Tax=Streptococcus sanguinis TaxID=1305 RepID=A0AB74DU96_STRSA|nr:ABC transporter permease [Streptococcus sanguinis]RSI50947.1 ABC-2 type transporter [Streptococcus sanguinis]
MKVKFNIISFKGEVIKQKKNYHNSLSSLLSLLVWPLLNFIYIYYTYRSFNISYLSTYGIKSFNEFVIFLITGSLVYNCFWAMVQSAFYLSFERQNGTLETVFITPTNIVSYLYGRAFGGLFTSLWMYISFTIITLFLIDRITVEMILSTLISLIIVIISATVWGAFINSVFLISRDSSYIFTICDEPMNIFSGATIPVSAFPVWGKFISYIFPATFCINIIRGIYKVGYFNNINYLYYIISMIFLIFLTFVISKYSYKKSKINGELCLY